MISCENWPTGGRHCAVPFSRKRRGHTSRRCVVFIKYANTFSNKSCGDLKAKRRNKIHIKLKKKRKIYVFIYLHGIRRWSVLACTYTCVINHYIAIVRLRRLFKITMGRKLDVTPRCVLCVRSSRCRVTKNDHHDE